MTNSTTLHMKLIQREQPQASELFLSTGGIDVKKSEISASNLPLALVAKQQPASGELPLALGNGSDSNDGGTDEPSKPRPKFPALFNSFDIVTSSAQGIANCQKLTTSHSKAISNDTNISTLTSVTVVNCQSVKTLNYVNISNCHQFTNSHTRQISKCQSVFVAPFFNISNCQKAMVSAIKTLENCNQINTQSAQPIVNCQKFDTVAVEQVKHCLDIKNKGLSIASLHDVTVQPAVPVPCRYYPIPPPPVVQPNTGACRLRSPSSDLPLMLGQKQTEMPASDLPLNLTCWHDTPALQIPKRDTYMIHTTITADIGGIAVEPLSFSIKSDMDGFCWGGEVSIHADDWIKIKATLEVERGNEPLVTVTINDESFVFIAENTSRSRQFVSHTQSISGRSISARLGADFAIPQTALLDQDNYARQLVNQQLSGLPITVQDWLVNDWLIPANAYSATNKTPLTVIADVADAVGGFIDSHPSEPTISIKPRWRVKAWELVNATPDVIIPADIIKKIDDSKRTNPRYNIVHLVGTTPSSSGGNVAGGIVYRQTQGRELPAPAEQNGLYSDRDCFVPKGIAILSDSGTHGDYTLVIPWQDKYNIKLANKGDIWQVGDPDGKWQGVVKGVGITVTLNDAVPSVWQMVTLDRYLDV